MPAKVFVGQRQEAFAVKLDVIFDLVNAPVGVITDPTSINAAAVSSIQDKNVTSFALEVHKSCLPQGSESVIGGWQTANLRQRQLVNPNPPSGHQPWTTYGGAWVQVLRLGMPLVNEVVIGLPDKDEFNASAPSKDGQFATCVTHPTLPALLEIALALPGTAPTNLPRLDLVRTSRPASRAYTSRPTWWRRKCPASTRQSRRCRSHSRTGSASSAASRRAAATSPVFRTAAARRTTSSMSRWWR